MSEQTNSGVDLGVSAPSIEERMQAFVKREEAPPPDDEASPPQEEAAPQEQPEAQADSDEVTESDLPDEDQAPKQAETVDEFEIVHNGAQHKLPRAEVIRLAQQGFDYTQKTQQVAEMARQASERLTKLAQLEQVHPHLEKSKAAAQSLEAQLQQWHGVDWVALATNDPLEYPKYQAQYTTLQQAYQQAKGQYDQQKQVVEREIEQMRAQMLESEAKRLPELVPAWKDPAKFEAAKHDMQNYLRANGADESQVGRYLDNALAMKVLWQAAQYEKLQKSKVDKVKQLRTVPPVSKPGAPSTGVDERVTNARQRLAKSGRREDAVGLLLARMGK